MGKLIPKTAGMKKADIKKVPFSVRHHRKIYWLMPLTLFQSLVIIGLILWR